MPTLRNLINGQCLPLETCTLTLTGVTQTEPSQPLSFVATVIDKATQQPPTKAVAIKISLTVDATSGGHDHGDSTRPRGSLNGVACETDDTCITLTAVAGSGTAPFTFTPRDASGKHTITASCDKCSSEGTGNTKTVEVKVDGLEPIPASAFYVFIGGEADKPHHDNHYLTPDAAAVLWNLALNYQVEPQFKTRNPATQVLTNPPLLHVNDASLVWGGRFDTKANWTNPHWEHMRGTVVDIRANNAPGAISLNNFKNFNQLLLAEDENIDFLKECTWDKKSTPKSQRHNRIWPDCISTLDGSVDTNRHYHIRLKGVPE